MEMGRTLLRLKSAFEKCSLQIVTFMRRKAGARVGFRAEQKSSPAGTLYHVLGAP